MENETNKNVYELGFHLVPTIEAENTAKAFGDIKEAIEKMGATVISSEMPKEMTLAYEMRAVIDNKVAYFTKSFFSWIKFDLDPSLVSGVKEMIEKRNDIIRFIIVSTVTENTLAPRKLFEKKEGGRKKKEEKSVPMDTEAVDAELDKMLDEEAPVETDAVEEALSQE